MSCSKRSNQSANQARKIKRYKILRIAQLMERPDFATNPELQAECRRLRKDIASSESPGSRLIEVLYNGEVIYTGTKEEVKQKCIKSISAINKLLITGGMDKQKRSYRWKY